MTKRTLWTWTLAGLLAVLAAGPAQALTIYFDGANGFGISATTAAGALAAGVPIIEVEGISRAVDLGLTIPEPDVMSHTLATNPSRTNPNRATSEWDVTNGGSGHPDSWLVFLYPTDYMATRVGFDIDAADGWAVIQVFDAVTDADYYYPAKFLGDMSPSETVSFLMKHRVATRLNHVGGELALPQYAVGGLQNVPEPAVLLLVGAGCVLAAALRRRSA